MPGKRERNHNEAKESAEELKRFKKHNKSLKP
jgi:hypothetical protein